MSLEPGQVIDAKYKVVRLIGEGGMGTVYEGENSRIGRRVAIKVLHAQVAAMPEFVERFEREARAAARIGSPHVCDVLDLGDLPNGDRYIVMEFLDGVSFEDRLEERGKLTPAQLAPIAFELLEGLGTMHGARVIHRDLKPANVFLSKIAGGRGEMVKILDFGVAKLQPFEGQVGTMTQTGTMMGTPLYMSPEQARGARDVDGRTDIYAASVMFYKAVTGELPYNAETLNELLFKIVLEDPKPLRELAPEVDEVFAAIIHKGLARDVAQRFASAREYQEAIAAWGKTQGRASLSFAVSLSSEPPPPPLTPITLPDRRDASPAVASAVTNAGTNAGTNAAGATGASGTPIAWSEDVDPAAKGAEQLPATVVTPIGLQGAAIASSRSAPGTSKPGPEVFGQTLPSSTPSGLASGGDGPAALARSGQSGNEASYPSRQSPLVPLAAASAPGSKRGLMMLGGGAFAALAIAGAVVLFRNGPAAAPNAAAASSGAGLVPAASAPPPGEPGLPAMPGSAASPTTTTSPTSESSAPTASAPSSPPTNAAVTAHAPPPRLGGTPTRPIAPAASTAAVPPSSAVAPPVASAAPAKPAASARKFRTNID